LLTGWLAGWLAQCCLYFCSHRTNLWPGNFRHLLQPNPNGNHKVTLRADCVRLSNSEAKVYMFRHFGVIWIPQSWLSVIATSHTMEDDSYPVMSVYFKLFDMIGIRMILVGYIITDGRNIRGGQDGWCHLLYGLVDFVYLFFSVINGGLNVQPQYDLLLCYLRLRVPQAIIRLGLMLVFSLIGPIFPGVCTYPGMCSVLLVILLE